MRNLIKFELRKILTKRFAVVSVAAVLLLSFILSFSTFQSMHAFDGESREGNGKTAVEIDKAVTAKYEGVLTDEKVQQIMSVEQMSNGLLYAIWAVPTALVLTVIGGTVSRRIFANHQVS